MSFKPGFNTAVYENGNFVRWDFRPHDDSNCTDILIINCPYIPIYIKKDDPFTLDEQKE